MTEYPKQITLASGLYVCVQDAVDEARWRTVPVIVPDPEPIEASAHGPVSTGEDEPDRTHRKVTRKK